MKDQRDMALAKSYVRKHVDDGIVATLTHTRIQVDHRTDILYIVLDTGKFLG